jgi:DNA-binding NarL/FixJ family response regulator
VSATATDSLTLPAQPSRVDGSNGSSAKEISSHVALRTSQPPSSEQRLRVLIVDELEVVQWGCRVLFRRPWVESCLAARDRATALALTVRREPHVALIDLFVGEDSGVEICKALRAVSKDLRVLMTSQSSRLSRSGIRAAGASGFIPKSWNAEDIVRAVRMVGMGMTVFTTETEPPSTTLSERERRVLHEIASGATNREIASRLYISAHTVKQHTHVLYRKLNARNRAEAVQRGQRLGLID